MLNYAVTFLIIALIAGVFGFGGVAAAGIDIARILFAVFLVLFLVSLVAHYNSNDDLLHWNHKNTVGQSIDKTIDKLTD